MSTSDILKALKDDGNKVRLELLPFEALEGVGRVLTFGAYKYGAHNWRRGFAYSRLIAASLRHLFSFAKGEDNDPETGESHLDHAICCLLFLSAQVKKSTGVDDRYEERSDASSS